MNSKNHWDKVYNTRQLDEVSWYQANPADSLDFIEQLQVGKSASIIDVGGGDSLLVDHLLDMGFINITVLDISEKAIDRAKKRLGEKADRVTWVIKDVLDFDTDMKFDLWHDRAAFHFLNNEEEIKNYISKTKNFLKSNGKMVIGTFSENGPEKCSGLPVKRYSEGLITETLKNWFEKIKCITVDHITPFNTIQNFMFCSFKKTGT